MRISTTDHYRYVTWGTWIPDPLFRLKINRMHRASIFFYTFPTTPKPANQGKHGSDSEVFTSTGEFDDERFNNVFDMYSEDPHTHLTFWQGVRMVHGNLNLFDPVCTLYLGIYARQINTHLQFGWAAAVFEWMATYLTIWPYDPKGMTKQDIKDVYDVRIFPFTDTAVVDAVSQGTLFYKIAGKEPY